ncbi:MAG: alpha/beta hydrolase [Gemmatimonadetes bacterium]|nr:alpha/beta hydrolase [Gemmatimonadota bacterium]
MLAFILSVLLASQVAPAEADAARALVGSWTGGIEQGGAVVLRLAARFEIAAPGDVVGWLDSPDQGTRDIAVTAVTMVGDSVQFAVPSLGALFRGTADSARARITGTWTQGATSITLSLARGSEGETFVRPQDPSPPFPYTESEIAYEGAGGLRLAGTLSVPAGVGPFPAVLLLSGSGAQDRDATMMGHRPFRVIADHLARRGIAVLRVDDRGVGGSAGNVMELTLADNARDAAAGVRFLRTHDRIDAARVGLIGHSEGGWVAPLLAAESDDVAFVVMLAGPAVAPAELLAAQARAMLTAAGAPLIEERIAMNAVVFDAIRREPDNERAIAAATAATRDWLDSQPDAVAAAIRAGMQSEEARAESARSLQLQTTPWFRGLLSYDPSPALRSVRVPVLALFGERDLQVPAAQSAPLLREMWAAHPDGTVQVMEGLNHFFQHASTGLPTEYAQIEETFAVQALELIADWIATRFPVHVHAAHSASEPAVATSQAGAQRGRWPAERRYFVGSSLFVAANLLPDDEPPAFFQVNAGYRVTAKDVVSLEVIAWHYHAPLGVPWGSGKGATKERYPGSVREIGVGVAYQRFVWNGLYIAALGKFWVDPLHFLTG